MEYQKVINLLGSTTNETLKIWTKAWVERNDDTKRDGSDAADNVYVIIVMHTYLLKELGKLLNMVMMMQKNEQMK